MKSRMISEFMCVGACLLGQEIIGACVFPILQLLCFGSFTLSGKCRAACSVPPQLRVFLLVSSVASDFATFVTLNSFVRVAAICFF